jgi:hypothetical protein
VSSEATAAKMFADEDLGPDGWRRREITAALRLLEDLHAHAEAENAETTAEGLWYLIEVIAGLVGEQLEEPEELSGETQLFVSQTVSQWLEEFREKLVV